MNSNPEYEPCPPRAEATIESLRSLGYNFGVAVSDIIDNSISANAKTIWIKYEWLGNSSSIIITDDGHGMTLSELKNAMRLGSLSPGDLRETKDLGRFGLGLKTASFSQCRSLTVKAKRDNQTNLRKWDLDFVISEKNWHLLTKTDAASEEMIDKELVELESGTVVLWQKLDRLITEDENEDQRKANFFLRIEELREYLSMIFHRYISGPNRIRIYLQPIDAVASDDYLLSAWDPFITNNPATNDLGKETLQLNENHVVVNPYILPHHSKFKTSKEHELAGGPMGWNRHQGFFIYRNRRLLVPGGWLDFFKQEDHYKLARIKIDISNCMDELWKIGVKKAEASAPDVFKDELKRIAKIARNEATKAYRFRGKVDKRGNPEVKEFVWKMVKTREGKVNYFVDQDHPVISDFINKTNDKKGFRSILKLISKTVPVETIVQSDREMPDAHLSDINSAKIDGIPVIQWYKDHMNLFMNTLNMTEQEAFEKISQIEPFNLYAQEIETYRGLKK